MGVEDNKLTFSGVKGIKGSICSDQNAVLIWQRHCPNFKVTLAVHFDGGLSQQSIGTGIAN